MNETKQLLQDIKEARKRGEVTLKRVEALRDDTLAAINDNAKELLVFQTEVLLFEAIKKSDLLK